MIKRTVEISQEPVHLAVQLDQLRLVRHEPQSGIVATIPCEDIGLVVVDQAGATYSHAALARLLDFGAAVLICGRNHLPVGLLLPLSTHTEVVWRIHQQIAIGKPLRKQLWKQLVVAKIYGQARNLDATSPARRRLLPLANEVKSGDPTNIESQAAKVYWPAWLGAETAFRRDPDGDDPLNAMLNYGYAVVRAAVGRALVSAGLHPALGLHHCNRGNAFCLADDLLEPLRPMVDRTVRDLYQEGQTELNRSAKARLLGLLATTVRVEDHTGPLMVGLHRTVASLVRCFQGLEKRLLLPVWLDRDE
jgi:CRISPR-associated protein Cas1